MNIFAEIDEIQSVDIIKYKEKELMDIYEGTQKYLNNLVLEGLYSVNKIPKKFIYMRQEKELEDIIYSMRYYQKYDKAAFYTLICLLEYFYKNYFELSRGVKDLQLTQKEHLITVTNDIRKKIINEMYTFIFNIPINPGKLQDQIYKIQLLLKKRMKMIDKNLLIYPENRDIQYSAEKENALV
jgi:hypothetical protein